MAEDQVFLKGGKKYKRKTKNLNLADMRENNIEFQF